MNDITIPRGVHSMIDARGKKRWRYKGGGKVIYLKGSPGTLEFDVSLSAALATVSENAELRGGYDDDDAKHAARQSARILRREANTREWARAAVNRCKDRAVRRGLRFDLTVDFLSELMKRQGFSCAVSGIEFFMLERKPRKESAFAPSVDRIDPEKGYTQTNIRLVCEIVNLAMHNWGERPLKQLVHQMSRRLSVK